MKAIVGHFACVRGAIDLDEAIPDDGVLLSPAAPSSATFAGTTCCDRCLLRIGARSVANLCRAGAALASRSALPTALDRCWAEAAAVMCYFVLPSLRIRVSLVDVCVILLCCEFTSSDVLDIRDLLPLR